MSDTIKLDINEDQSFAPEQFFNQQWKLYQKVLNNNYMGHQEIYNILHELLVNHFPKPFKMLDLGCGDASFTSQALLNTNIVSYLGIDLSVTALEIAKQNMAIMDCETNFIPADFSESVSELAQNQQNKFDAILISFALHHLQLEQKDSFIANLKNLLTSNGIFILIDIVRQETEERESYINRYLEGVQEYWSLLSPEEYWMVENHISSSDFPETQQTLQQISDKYGFSKLECLYSDRTDTTKLLCFYSA
ncbi:class I SAM-dependent methyltransferase [Cronbergia sp. UHCC 0137]|uniref:class I SAM-dependent methyltransferase n=1 Tax=Cronbergia sp. UHCC 0137 TaxID=3110239 RepID=UPI002B22181C|nr:class I SAM-dependent methyltransferase [Cronbergia sp. UHCC 0137]MEA5619086.1 class I SAM-dependent methyltransferase [Cronbergia sp. UHCC 0137]